MLASAICLPMHLTISIVRPGAGLGLGFRVSGDEGFAGTEVRKKTSNQIRHD